MDILTQILKPLSALSLPDKALPKYLYPSAGSSYAIQAYISIPNQRIPSIAGGEYYYHPIKHELQRTKDVDPEFFGISFQLFLPAIEPLYKDASLRLGFLEMGHILYCLENSLSTLPITHQIEIQNDRENDHHLLLTLHFDVPETIVQKRKLHKSLLHNQEGFFSCEGREFDLKQESLPFQASETGQLLSQASCLLVFEGESNPENWIAAGYEAQAISEESIEKGVGSCPIGILPYDHAVYALATGNIDASQLEQAESKGESIPVDRQIAEELRGQLPSYMVPEVYFLLPSFPLTTNGKVDYQALSLPETSPENAYSPPVTPIETAMAEIWQSSLSIDRIGIHDDFFRLGGNSLLAIRTAHRLSKVLGKHVKVIDLFKERTIANLVNLLSDHSSDIAIGNTEEKTVPLSFAQERLWFIEKYEQSTHAYHIPIGFKLTCDQNVDAVKKALQSIVSRHEILRTVYFQDENGKNYQRVTDQRLTYEESETNLGDLHELITEQVNRVFDLETELPIRVALFQTESLCFVSIVIHHIAFDGWSSDIFIREINEFYNHYTGDTPLCLPELAIQYKDFALWQTKHFQNDPLDKQRSYWEEKLKEIEPLYFPTDYPRPAQMQYEGDRIAFTLNEETSSKLRELAKEHHVTLFTVLLTGFSILIHKYTGQSDIVVGTPIASRFSAQVGDLIGFFVNTIAIRQSISREATGNALFKEFHETILEAQTHQDLPFEKLVELLGVERDQSRHPLFQIMFRVQDFSAPSQFESYQTEEFLKASKFDLDLLINDKGPELKGTLTYSTALFKSETAERVVNHYAQLLQELLKEPTRSVKEYPILTPEEYEKIVYQWNQTSQDELRKTTFCQLFEEQVSRTPHKTAVSFDNQQVTYDELNRKANQLARTLRKQIRIQPDTLIALCMTRSVEMIIGILAIMKAKGAYVPIDPAHPNERIAYILQDTKAPLILTHSTTLDRVKATTSIPRINVSPEERQTESGDNLVDHPSPADLAYVIYTSGTSGNPKGVLVSHDSICAYIHAAKEHLSDCENVDFSSELSFDLSVTTTLLPLATGKRIYIFKGRLTQVNAYVEHINKNQIDFIKSTPSYLSQVPFEKILHRVKVGFLGGEKCDTHHIQSLLPHFDRLYDEYGPTEATVGTTLHLCSGEDHHIGKPYPNYQVYVLDSQMEPVPIGVIGELYIGGRGVAQGYLNLSSLTKEKFIENPFVPKGSARLYKTGDLVKWLPDGNLEYIGRNDFQVKIRGYRIELEEIESAMGSIPEIRQACACVHQNSRQEFLVGYYIAEENRGKGITESDVRMALSEKLPSYMVPDHLIEVDRFPLTQHGKLDRGALPAPNLKRDEASVSPVTDIEKELCRIWERVLDCKNVGIMDDFFRIGGNSILAIQASHQMSRALGREIQVSSLFRHKNIDSILKSLKSKEVTESSHVTLLSEEERAEKPCLFLIHGVGGNIAGYYKVIELLESHYNLYGIQSRKHFENYREMVQEYSQNMDAVLHKMNTKRYHIIGWSFGASCALELISSLSNAYDCDQAFIIDGAPVDDKRSHSLSRAADLASLADNLKNLLFFYKDAFGLEGEVEAMTEEELLRYLHQVLGYSREEDLTIIEGRVSIALMNIRNHVSHSKSVPSHYQAKKFHIINAEKTKCKFEKWEHILHCKDVEIAELPGDHWSIMKSSKLFDYLRDACYPRVTT